eukprot:SAG22_NODE_20648_length_264_cov_0.612121_1_plen_46_part_10
MYVKWDKASFGNPYYPSDRHSAHPTSAYSWQMKDTLPGCHLLQFLA